MPTSTQKENVTKFYKEGCNCIGQKLMLQQFNLVRIVSYISVHKSALGLGSVLGQCWQRGRLHNIE